MSVLTRSTEGKGYVAMNGSRGLLRASKVRRAKAARRGFTLIELLVTIAAVAVLSLGLAQIFAVTGRTVSAGRRLSNLTAAANVLERQLREDIAKLTREGFLLIRNERTSTTIANAGSAPDTKRLRRLDELVFFVNGQFSSVRLSPLDQRTARASAARVYYGHGLQRSPDNLGDPERLALKFDDDNAMAPKFGKAPGSDVSAPAGTTNPNQYAGDWILARQLTLLVPPSSSSPDKLLQGSGAPPERRQIDNAWQIGLQPAAPSIFRNHRAQVEPTANDLVVSSRYNGNQPVFASGTIDVAATDLATIRVLMQGATPPYSATSATAAAPLGDGLTSIDTTGSGTELQQQWMQLALPAASDRGERLRVEALPPNFLGIREGSRPSNADLVTDPLVANQLALASTAFMPRCSEFIVEWSFGDTDATAGRLIWHGLQRQVLSNRDDPASAVAYTVDQYFNSNTDGAVQNYTLRDGTPMTWSTDKELINNLGGGFGNPRLYAYFGFNDPTYSPANSLAFTPSPVPSGYTPKKLYIDNGQPGVYEPDLGDLYNAPETIPWKWPKLLRITMSLVDPQDPTIEQSFQFIFNLPERSPGTN